MLSTIYGEVASRRRAWYAGRPDTRRRLRRPVVSVGALSVGGSGKTPVVAHLAELLSRMNEHPAVLSRGYGRRRQLDGVVVVRTAGDDAVRAELDTAGDEPLMLARRLSGVSVLVCADRYPAGVLAERRLGATVHLLDDGFQHLSLDRDVDLLVVGAHDLDDPRTVPGGRLRERPDSARAAHALVVETESADEACQLAAQFGVAEGFHFTRRLGTPRDAVTGAPHEPVAGEPVLVVAGIARPKEFAEGLRLIGYTPADVMGFRDHHRYTARDLDAITASARTLGATRVLTTEKDLVRLLPYAPFDPPLAWVPLSVTVEPAERFQRWLGDRLAAAADRADSHVEPRVRS